MKWAGMAAALSQQYSPNFLGVLAPPLGQGKGSKSSFAHPPHPHRLVPWF